MNQRRSRRQPQISVIVPALHEAANLPELAARIDTALLGRDYELLIIDDASNDGTIEICDKLAQDYPLNLYTRTILSGGLSGAVLGGFAFSRGEILVVMDADLQHPPEFLPALIDPIVWREADFVIGSRYVLGGRIQDDWGILRHLNSGLATLLARPLNPGVRDPMSGFFALTRLVWQRAERLDPMGYKIALELLCKCKLTNVVEVPITFGLRRHGRSKLSLKEQIAFLKHLTNLYLRRYPWSVGLLAPLRGLLRIVQCRFEHMKALPQTRPSLIHKCPS